MNSEPSDFPPVEPTPERIVVFEDLTLAQALAYLFWQPVQTARLFWKVLTRDMEQPAAGAEAPLLIAQPLEMAEEEAPFPITERMDRASGPEARLARPWLAGIGVGVLLLAVLLAIKGGLILHAAALNPLLHANGNTNGATAWFVLAGSLYLGLELLQARFWWIRQFPRPAAWLRRHVYQAPSAWNVLLGMLLVLALWLGLILGGVWIPAALFVLAGLSWLVIVIGNTHLPESAADENTGEAGREAGEVFVVRSQAAPAAAERARPQEHGFWVWFQAHAYRLMLVPPALLFSALTYHLNVARDVFGKVNDVVLTTTGFVVWMLSIALWIVLLTVDVETVWKQGRFPAVRLPRLSLERIGTLLALAAITALGTYFRLYRLAAVPPEMTSDHIEKLLDALRVSDGYRGVFFPNNGGREGFQMYVVAFIARTLGVGFNFKALKLATVIEGVITLPALWWMARQMFGSATERSRRLGNWVGLALAGLVAISSWHVMLSRLGLRIVLTPLTTALVVGFLARAMRHNRMRDYAALGVMLGAGVYFYQANRMLPLLVGVGAVLVVLGRAVRTPRQALRPIGEGIGMVVLAVTPLLAYWYLGQVLKQSSYVNPHTAGDRMLLLSPLFIMVWFSILALIFRARRADSLLPVGGGFLATVVIALALYIPMYHYSQLYPDYFWNRTWGRLFGEDAFQRVDPQTGVLATYMPSIREQVERFWDQRDVFEQNYWDALRMFHWTGDGAWISNPHGRPALGGLAGGLMILGLLAWGVWVFRRPDPISWLVPFGILILLLPSAMTLAYVIENPNFTRASGTLPLAFFLAALPLGMLCWRAAQLPWVSVLHRRVVVGPVLAAVMLGSTLWYGIGPDWDNYFTAYRLEYIYSWKPYSLIAVPLREFAHGEGSYGNAFMIAYPYWLDHRILGTMAGDIRWPNGLITREDVFNAVARNRGTPYQFDPSKPIFFMYNALDTESAQWLQANFPGGQAVPYEYSYETEAGTTTDMFYIYTAPADWLQ